MEKKEERQRHMYGYYLDAPLPAMLTYQDMIGDVKRFENKDGKEKTFSLNGTEVDTDAIVSFAKNMLLNDPEGKERLISEKEFVTTWLPLMHEAKPLMINGEPHASDYLWVKHVSKSPYSSVGVVRDGVVIFRVPPVAVGLESIGQTDRERRITELYLEYKRKTQYLPSLEAEGEEWLMNEIDQGVKEQKKQNMRMVSKWRTLLYIYILDEIFVYYGYDSILTDEIMSFKQAVMGDRYNEYYTSGILPQSKPKPNQLSDDIVEDDEYFDNLFDEFNHTE